MKLIIGNKTYSSWSLRPWLLMRHFAINFDEVLVKLDMPDTRANILAYSPSGRVPVLIDGGLVIWESLAIMEYLAEKFPDKRMWPVNQRQRAIARSVANEMHAGFANLRKTMPHHLKKRLPGFDSSKVSDDIKRIKEIWTSCLEQSGGPFLFGDFTIADAMYAPVVNRFITYDVSLVGAAREYAARVRELPAHQEWIDGAMKEDFIAPMHD